MVNSKHALYPVLFFVICTFSLSFTLSTAQARQATDEPNPISLIWQHAAANPLDFGVACMPLEDPAALVTYNAGEEFPLASVSKLLIFIEYGRRLTLGLLPYDETVSVETLDRYNLPRTDRGAHDRFMEQFPEGTTTLRLYDVAVQGMMQYSSNAASDYLLHRLEPVDWATLYAILDLNGSSIPHSLTAIPLAMNNHEDGEATLDDIADRSIEQGERYLERYIEDETWRAAEIEYRSGRRSMFPDWEVQSAFLQAHTALGTVSDYVKVMEAIYGARSPLYSEVRAMARAALRWDLNDYVIANYVEYGSKLGFYSGGTLTLVAYGQPIGRGAAISIAFIRNIPQRLYNEMVREDSIGWLADWLIQTNCAELEELIRQELPAR